MTADRPAPEIQPLPYSFGAAFAQGWELLGARYGMVLAGTGIYLGVTILIQLAQRSIQNSAGPIAAFFLGVPMALLVAAPFKASWTWAAVAASRGEAASASTLVHAFDRYPQTVALAALASLASMMIGIPFALLALVCIALGPAALLLLLVLALPFAVLFGWLFVRFELANCLILDERLGRVGVFEAVRTAFGMSRGLRGWSLFGLTIVVGLIAGLSGLLLILPIIFFGLPFMAAVNAMAYQQLAGDHGLIASVNCRFCGFDLTGLPGRVCPECGAPRTDPAQPLDPFGGPGGSGLRS